MKTTIEKLDLFLELALMDKQFAMILHENQKNLLIEKLKRKTGELIETEKLEELKSAKTGIVLFALTKANIKELMEWIKRVLPTFNQYRIVPEASDCAKMIFLLDKKLLEELPKKEQEQILAAFLPIFDFSND